MVCLFGKKKLVEKNVLRRGDNDPRGGIVSRGDIVPGVIMFPGVILFPGVMWSTGVILILGGHTNMHTLAQLYYR